MSHESSKKPPRQLTAPEARTIKLMYPTQPTAIVAMRLGMTQKQVRGYARTLGVKKIKRRRWWQR